jgi:uncharacterized protein (TIGR02453 family)
MIHPATLDFLRKLKKNNNREWFEKNRAKYEEARQNVEETVAAIIAEVRKFDKQIPADLDPKKCLFRIYRDVRFSHDKRPYKNNIGAYISAAGKKAVAPGFYIHFEPGTSFLAGGMWQPPAPELSKVRQEIDYNFSEFKKIVNDKTFRKHFGTLDQEDKLATSPKGYPKDHEGIEFLKLKSYTVTTQLSDKDVSAKTLAKKAGEIFKAMHPLNQFLQRAID